MRTKNWKFLCFGVFLLVINFSFQSCQDASLVSDQTVSEVDQNFSKGLNLYSGEVLSEEETRQLTNDVKFLSSGSNMDLDFRNVDVTLTSKSEFKDLSQMDIIWRESIKIPEGAFNTSLKLYTYDSGNEMLILTYANGEKNEQEVYIRRVQNNGESSRSGDDPVIRVNCKGHCDEETQDCTELANILTGNVACTCQSNNCYMELEKI